MRAERDEMDDREFAAFLDLPEASPNGSTPAVEGNYIWVNNWDHYQRWERKRGRKWRPSWVKLWHSLWDNQDFLDLPIPTRMLLVGLFYAFSMTHGDLPNNTRTLSRILDQRVTNKQLELLNHAGFISFCSRTVREQLWNTFMNGSPLDVDVDVDVDVEPPYPPQKRGNKPSKKNTNTTCPNCDLGGGHHLADCPQVRLPTTVKVPT